MKIGYFIGLQDSVIASYDLKLEFPYLNEDERFSIMLSVLAMIEWR